MSLVRSRKKYLRTKTLHEVGRTKHPEITVHKRRCASCLLGEANLEQRLVHVLELSRVVPSRHLRDGALLVADLVVLPLCQPERLAHRRGRLGEHVEDVVVSLAWQARRERRERGRPPEEIVPEYGGCARPRGGR